MNMLIMIHKIHKSVKSIKNMSRFFLKVYREPAFHSLGAEQEKDPAYIVVCSDPLSAVRRFRECLFLSMPQAGFLHRVAPYDSSSKPCNGEACIENRHSLQYTQVNGRSLMIAHLLVEWIMLTKTKMMFTVLN